MAQKYAISSLSEAKAYLQHPVLGPRLEQCTRLVNQVERRSVHDIFGYPDDLKFHSSMTLFGAAQGGEDAAENSFRQALRKHFAGESDTATLNLLQSCHRQGP